MKNMFKNRKTLYFILSIVLVFVFTLTIAYAALNTVLKITGTAEVVASSWDIYLDNVQLVSGSATTTKPTITNKTTASFTTTLTNPGDYYMFTIDVVNNGSIDAMIDSIEKTPTLTETQAKYVNYIVEYENGESINTRQLVEKNSFVRLKVKVEFRKDLVASDLPTSTETLSLAFEVNYIQAEESGTTSVENAGKLVKVVSGDYDTIGSEICIGEECFYVISSTDDDVTMFAKYNLYVGGEFSPNDIDNDGIRYELYGDEASNLQHPSMQGFIRDQEIRNGVTSFSDDAYWFNYTSNYPAYIYDENSVLYGYLQNYSFYLESLGMNILDIRLIRMDELYDLGCTEIGGYCSTDSPSWVYSTTYWTGIAVDKKVAIVSSSRLFQVYNCLDYNGVRPVITIPKSDF